MDVDSERTGMQMVELCASGWSYHLIMMPLNQPGMTSPGSLSVLGTLLTCPSLFFPSLVFHLKQLNWASRLSAGPVGLTYLLPVLSDSLLVSLVSKTSLSAPFRCLQFRS